MRSRVSKEQYYLNIAYAISQRSPCLRRRVGATLVRDDVILSTGYNGPPRKTINCDEVGCLKDLVGAPHGLGWEYCPAVHAEENCIANAARQGVSVLGSTLYVAGEFVGRKSLPLNAAEPCERCKKMIINAGIKKVVMRCDDGKVKRYEVEDWVREERENYLRRLEEAKGR